MENRPAALRSRRVCRFCLTESEPLHYIYERDHTKPFQVPLTLQIMSCVAIEVYAADGMPQMICSMCRWNVDRAYKFKLQCKKADEALRAYPLSGVLPRPFPPISTDPPETNNKRSMEQRSPNEPVKKPRVDNGDRQMIRERENQRSSDLYEEEQDNGSEEEQESKDTKEKCKLEPGEIRVHACDQCERTFPLHQALVLHVQRAHRDRNYKCTECERMFFSKYDLSKHMSTHSEDKPFSCPICQKQFSRANLLQRHEKVHRDELRYGCQHCDREFFTTEELEKHEEAVHKREKPFQCNICNKRFTYKQGLERHEMLHSEDKSFVCEYCKEAFRTSTKLARHLTTHAGHRPYLCKLCPRTFLLSHHLTRHMRSHSVEKRHVCEDCGKAFKRKESLDVHQLTHTKRTGMGLTCDVCQESCRNRADYVTHIKQHIEAGEKMGPDGLAPDTKTKIELDSEEEDEEEEEHYSDGDDDYHPPSSYTPKKMTRSKSQIESDEEGDPIEKEQRKEQVVFMRDKDGNVVKKTIKTLMPIQRREVQETKPKSIPTSPPSVKTPQIKQIEDIIPKTRDDTEAQVQKIVASVFKEHKIPLKHQNISEGKEMSPPSVGSSQSRPHSSQSNQTPQASGSEDVKGTNSGGSSKSVNTVKVIKRIVVRKPAGEATVVKENEATPGTVSGTTPASTSGPKVTKRVIVRRIIRTGDTTREVIMNPDGTIIDPAELAKLPTGNVVKRVVVKKPLDKSQALVQAVLQSSGVEQRQTANVVKTSESILGESPKFELKTSQATITPSTPKANPNLTKGDQETKEKLEQLEKRVEQQRLKIEELQARKQQESEPIDEILPERHDESEDEQQLPLKRVFVKRKQSIYDEEKEYNDNESSKPSVPAKETKDPWQTKETRGNEMSTPPPLPPRREGKPLITSSRVYENKKIIVVKTNEVSEVEEMNRELNSILETTDSVVKMQENVLCNLTQISSIDAGGQKVFVDDTNKEIPPESTEAMEQSIESQQSESSQDIIMRLEEPTASSTQMSDNEIKIESEPIEEEVVMEPEESQEVSAPTTVEEEQHPPESSDNILMEQSSVEMVESRQPESESFNESVISLDSSANQTIQLTDNNDSQDSLEDKLSRMEG